jgi:hypothetical protein
MRDAGPGRWLLAGVAVATATGGFAADWNRTHLFNPAWPPHAKFHDGWSIGLMAGTGASALYLLAGRTPAEPGLAAALLAQAWGAQALAYAFPGAGDVRSEFPERRDRPGLTQVPEWAASAVALGLIAAGHRLERRDTLRRSARRGVGGRVRRLAGG